jgi:ParB/RepB/Spo0J family partition protein
MQRELEEGLDLLDEGDAEEVRADREPPAVRLARVKGLLGVSAPVAPAERGVFVRFELMDIPGAELVKRAAASMSASFELVAVMHPPSLKPTPDGRYTVLAGRRRCLAMIRDGVEGTPCNIYPPDLTDSQAALITLVENHSRGAAWVRDVGAIAELLHVARLTIDDLAALFGRARSGIAELARIAKLPDPILEQVYAGRIVQADAKAITRLRAGEIDRLAGLAASGAEITPAEIRRTLRGQWDEGMSRPLAQVLDMPAGPSSELQDALDALADDTGFSRADVTSEDEPPPEVFSGDWGKPAIVDVLATLASDTSKPARVRTLAKALRAELERLG